MTKDKLINFFDRAMVFTLCALIYFLPISIALVETFTGMTVFLFLLKRLIIVFTDKRLRQDGDPRARLKTVYSNIRPADTGANKFLAFYVIAVALSCVFSIDPAVSWRAMGPKLLERCLLFFAFCEVMIDRKRINWFLGAYSVSVLLISIAGLYQFITGTEFIRGSELASGRVRSSLAHPNDLGLYLITAIPIILSLINGLFTENRTGNGNKKHFSFISILLGVALFLSLADLGLTFSRGAWAGLVGALIFWTWKQKEIRKISLLVIGLFLFIFLPVGHIVRYQPNDEAGMNQIEKHLKFISDPQGRQEFWKQAISVIKVRPIAGSGFNTYVKAVEKFHQGNKWGEKYYAHNCYLQITAETGIMGLIGFAGFLVMIFRKALINISEKKGTISAGIMASLIAYSIHCFLDTGFYSVQLNTLFWLVCGLNVISFKFSLKNKS